MIIILPAMIIGSVFGFLPIPLVWALTVVLCLVTAYGALVFFSTIWKGDGVGLIGLAIGLPIMVGGAVTLAAMWGVNFFVSNYQITALQ